MGFDQLKWCCAVALALGAGCGEAPPREGAEGAPAVPAPTPASADWPQRFAPGAHEPILAAVLARAKLPSVPDTAASSTQRVALDQAANLTKRLSLKIKVDLAQNLARVYQENLFPERALEVLGLCLERDPNDPLTLKLLAGSLSAEGRFEDALKVLEHLTRETPNDAGLAGPLFNAHWELGDLAGARAAIERGVELAPFLPHLELALGRILMAEGDAAAAQPRLARATTNLPTDTEAWYRYALCLDELGRFEEAEHAMAVHKRLDQMKEFGIDLNQPERARRAALVDALAASGDAAGAQAERAALDADFPPE